MSEAYIISGPGAYSRRNDPIRYNQTTMISIDIDIGVTLKAEYLAPTSKENPVKIAICLHPWSWLGGNMHDP
jgi:hypothetical protein